jgi:hypothetical protein
VNGLSIKQGQLFAEFLVSLGVVALGIGQDDLAHESFFNHSRRGKKSIDIKLLWQDVC